MRIGAALLGLIAALSATSPAARGEPGEADGDTAGGEEAATFESLTASAETIGDAGALLGALVDRCPEEKRGSERLLDRARCRAMLAFLRQALPEHPFSLDVQDPAAISVSPYDEALKGYRLGLSACIACTSPIRVGRATEPVYVTLKKPADKRADRPADKPTETPRETLAAAVEIASLPLGFASPAEARRWLAEVRPHLRAQLVFNARASEWRWPSTPATPATRGYALELVAGRIVDGCSGAVVVSVPPSTGLAERSAVASSPTGGCRPAARVAPARRPTATPDEPQASDRPASDGHASDEHASDGHASDDEEEQLPSELSKGVIAAAMGRIRGQIFACFKRFGVPGVAPLTYEVAGNGLVQSVRLGGPLGGTPTGECLVEAARAARFPRFDGPIQTFTYPFFLRR